MDCKSAPAPFLFASTLRLLRQMRNFLFQVGLAYYRLGDIATALECFERAEEEKLRRQSDEDSATTTVNRRLTAAGSSSEGFDDSSLHYHR